MIVYLVCVERLEVRCDCNKVVLVVSVIYQVLLHRVY